MALWIIGPRQMIASFLVLLEEAHGHDLDSESFRRGEAVVVSHLRGLGDPHGLDHVRAVDVHVQDADACAVLRQGDGEG